MGMVDVSAMIAAKSDQLNADDLMRGPITITVTDVKATGDKEQPLSISYKNDCGKPYKPGKSMRRVLVQLWGDEGSAYIGRSMTLYRDGEVTFGKLKVGGIRISHMTDIGVDQILALAVTKGAKRAYEVKPLRMQEQRETTIEDVRGWIKNAATIEDLGRAWKQRAAAPFREALQSEMESRKAVLSEPATGRRDEEHGDQHDDTDDDTTDDHPARALADEAILRCERAAIVGDVIGAKNDFAKHREAAPDKIVKEVDRAIATAKARLKGGA